MKKYLTHAEFWKQYGQGNTVRFYPMEDRVMKDWKYYLVTDKSAKYYRSQSRSETLDNLAGFVVPRPGPVTAVLGFDSEDDALMWMLSN